MTSDSPGPSDPARSPRPAVVLLSGGLDSATTAAIARAQGFALHTVAFDYGQRHARELQAAEAVAHSLNVRDHRVVPIDLRACGGSALTADIDVPKDRAHDHHFTDIPVTYVPARNTVFLSYALALAEVLHSDDIFIGVNAIDYSGYPDCRPEYIAAFQTMARLATRAGVEGSPLTIHTPLIDLPKTEIIRRGLALGVDYGLTHSCYDPLPSGRPCARCDSCTIRQHAFAELGMTDPLLRPH
ncbi:MAG: 7-cyano-7-deazaguanine synthase QueC [Phycisphaeraceae bacterium]